MDFSVSTLSGCPLYCSACDIDPCPVAPSPTPVRDALGRPIYVVPSSGRYFLLTVEAQPQGVAVDTVLLPGSTAERPGLQMLSVNRLGPATPLPGPVDCRTNPSSPAKWGGIPGIPSLDYSTSQTVTDALTDLACRFQVYSDPSFSCTLDVRGNYTFRNPEGGVGGTVQFCHRVDSKTFFPSGVDTILRVRTGGADDSLGPPSEIVVRVAP